jgi:hypothetical protein
MKLFIGGLEVDPATWAVPTASVLERSVRATASRKADEKDAWLMRLSQQVRREGYLWRMEFLLQHEQVLCGGRRPGAPVRLCE